MAWSKNHPACDWEAKEVQAPVLATEVQNCPILEEFIAARVGKAWIAEPPTMTEDG